MRRTTQRIQRQESILYSLRKLDYLTRSQIQTIHRIGSARHSRKVLQEIEEEGWISSFRNDRTEKIYYLTKHGCEIVGGKPRRKTQNITHYLMRNQFYIYCGCPSTWENEMMINDYLVCDAKFVKDRRPVVIEIDHQQTTANNTKKIQRYVKIREESLDEFTLIWVTSTHARKIRLEKQLEGLNSCVYLYSDIL